MNVVQSRYSDEIAYAVRLVLGHTYASLPAYRVGRDTEIEAQVCAKEKEYCVVIKQGFKPNKLCLRAYDEKGNDVTKSYMCVIRHCIEWDVSDVFCGADEQTPFKLLQYLEEDRYYRPKELSRRTDRLSEMKSFRSYLNAYIKDSLTERIREGKRYELRLEANGKYAVGYKDDYGTPVCLSESEQTIFRYLCFLKTAEFWRGFEEIRNLHGIGKPLLVQDFLERLDESIDVNDLLQRTLQLHRQMIILTV